MDKKNDRTFLLVFEYKILLEYGTVLLFLNCKCTSLRISMTGNRKFALEMDVLRHQGFYLVFLF